jgi:hypothetical protein
MNVVSRAATVMAAMIPLVAPAAAHHIWIEPDDSGTLQMRFGEFNENLREVSGALLDRIEPAARLVSGAQATPIETKRGNNGIALSRPPGPGESLLVEDARSPVNERKSGDKITRTVYQPAARFVSDLAERPAALTLDVVPTGEAGHFKAVFRGAQLAKAKVNVVAASGWMQEMRADDSGNFKASFPWKGLYAIEVQHADSTPGERNGKAYDLVNFVTTLSLVVPTGLESLPPPPVRKPR